MAMTDGNMRASRCVEGMGGQAEGKELNGPSGPTHPPAGASPSSARRRPPAPRRLCRCCLLEVTCKAEETAVGGPSLTPPLDGLWPRGASLSPSPQDAADHGDRGGRW